MSEACNVFISHIHEDDSRLGALKELLASQGCEARDSSINSSRPNNASDPAYIKSQILAPQIAWAGTVVVLISPGTHQSDWVNWEIEYAAKIGKRVIGVWDQGAQDSDIPLKLDEFASAVVGWNGERIIDAIFGRTNDWQCADGGPRAPRDIARHNC